MNRAFQAISLRAKITASFVLIVVAGTTVSTLMGSRIITQELLVQERKRVNHGLEAARMIYASRLVRVQSAVVSAASNNKLLSAVRGDIQLLPSVLATLQGVADLDFLTYVDAAAQRPIRAEGKNHAPARSVDRDPVAASIRRALSRQTVASTELVDAEILRDEDAALAERARIRLKPLSREPAPASGEISAGLVLTAAAPVEIDGKIAGAVYGGVLLNRNVALVEQIKEIVFGSEEYQGRGIGVVSMFLDDVRISTSVRSGAGDSAIGTRVAVPVAQTVLARGAQWNDRAFVIEEWYVTAYEPIRNSAGVIIGMLGVGTQESPYLAVRTNMMITFLIVAVGGVLIVLLLTYLITRTMIRPLEEMAAATKKIAAGSLDLEVHVPSRDEIGTLAMSFNTMVTSLKAMTEEREEWAHTLEVRVRERTAELVRVQAQMAQAEKLASLGRVAAGVAHEINNPLGGIMTFASLALEDCGTNDPLRRNLDIVVKQTLRCREIVKGLLDFSRQSEASTSLIDVGAIVDQTLMLLENQAIFHNIRTVRAFAPELPRIFVDPGQLQQVIMNLVLNALDAMDRNGVLTVETRHDRQTHDVVIGVRDTGKGIPENALPFIFEPFFTTKEVGQGTGLGLAIVHGIVTRSGGRIEVSSSTDGTTITVRFPVGPE